MSGDLPNLMLKLRRNESVMLNILDEICYVLECNCGDITDYNSGRGKK